MNAKELSLDVSAEGARALQRVVRAMHDGHCPRCGHLAPAAEFQRYIPSPDQYSTEQVRDGHACPTCDFEISAAQEHAALAAFAPHFRKSVEVFEAWRSGNLEAFDGHVLQRITCHPCGKVEFSEFTPPPDKSQPASSVK